MDKNTVTQRIRERLDAGSLSPTAHVSVDTSIGVVRCAACDEPGAQVAYRFPDGRILRFHGQCHRIWEEECQRGPRSA